MLNLHISIKVDTKILRILRRQTLFLIFLLSFSTPQAISLQSRQWIIGWGRNKAMPGYINFLVTSFLHAKLGRRLLPSHSQPGYPLPSPHRHPYVRSYDTLPLQGVPFKQAQVSMNVLETLTFYQFSETSLSSRCMAEVIVSTMVQHILSWHIRHNITQDLHRGATYPVCRIRPLS